MPPTSYYAESQSWHIWRECGKFYKEKGERGVLGQPRVLKGRLFTLVMVTQPSHHHHTTQRSSSPCSVRPCSWWLPFPATGVG